jgi:hypothetical protein
VSEWRISWDIEHAILPIADILSASISWLGARRCGSFRRSRPTPLSNMRILPRSETLGFLRCVLIVSPCDPFSCCERQAASKLISGAEDSRRKGSSCGSHQRMCFCASRYVGLLTGDSRLLFILIAVIWTTNHGSQAVRRTGLAQIKCVRCVARWRR